MRPGIFCNTMGYLPLQRHLLAVLTHTLEDAVKAGNEYLQVKPANERGSTNVRQIRDEDKEELQNHPTRTAKKGELSKERVCWECGKEGHLKRNCLHLKTHQPSDQIVQRNRLGPQQ